jgi:hypothetical protein
LNALVSKLVDFILEHFHVFGEFGANVQGMFLGVFLRYLCYFPYFVGGVLCNSATTLSSLLV